MIGLMVSSLFFAQTSGFVQRPGFDLYYQIRGSGPPIVLIPGGPGFVGEVLLPIAERLTPFMTVVTYDQRGTGKSKLSDFSKFKFDYENLISDLEALRLHLKIDKWSVFGQSWGQVFATQYAARYPHHISKLILASNVGLGEYAFRLRANLFVRQEQEEQKALAELAQKNLNEFENQSEYVRITLPTYFYDTNLGREIQKQWKDELFSAEAFWAIANQALSKTPDPSQRLRKLTAPTLIIQGRQDPCGEIGAEELKAAIPNAKLVFIDKCGHFSWWEQPEKFFGALIPFLKPK